MEDIKDISQVLLYSFFQGETSLSEEILIRQWHEASPENAKRLIEERKMFDALIAMESDKKSVKRKFVVFQSKTRIILRVAAVIAIALLTSFFMSEVYRNKYEKYSSVIQKVKVPAGQRISLDLPDGTVVWLNSLSVIEYSPFELIGGERRIKLIGEAYFEVETDKQRPFVVETDKGHVEVMGTKFYVEAYPEDNSFITSLIEGSVKIVAGGNSLYLKPNQKVFLDNKNLIVSEINNQDAYSWREGLFSFSDKSFSDIMKKFEKYFGVEIKLENDLISNVRYTGKFRYSDGICYALKVLQRDVDFQYNRNKQGTIIYIK